MRKLSEINEGVWTQGIRRSSDEETVRKEDDVNGMNMEKFFEYLGDRYKFVDEHHSQMRLSNNGIAIPLFRLGYTWFSLYIKFEENNIKRLLINAYKESCKDFYDVVASKFELTHTDNGIIVTKNNKISNSICVELIDTVLANTKTPIYNINILNR